METRCKACNHPMTTLECKMDDELCQECLVISYQAAYELTDEKIYVSKEEDNKSD